MATYIRADEAARILGVTKPTLYAYVSRGLVERSTAVDGRTSLYEREAIEELAARSRRPGPIERPSIDVQITSAITQLDDRELRYRGHPVAELVVRSGFEQVAELLWSGDLPAEPVTWEPAPPAVAGERNGAIAELSALSYSVDRPGDDGAATARRLLATVPTALGGPDHGSVAARLAAAWGVEQPEVVHAVDRALVLLADHELATSTLAVRVAASVRASPGAAIAAGLAVVSGPLHGGASVAAAIMLQQASVDGPEAVVDRIVGGRQRLPGFGHSVYRVGDPRFELLMDAVRAIPDQNDRVAVVDELVAVAGTRIDRLPNIDLALGALFLAAGLPPGTPLFAIARIAGWAAHYDEELAARPVRFRGLATSQ